MNRGCSLLTKRGLLMLLTFLVIMNFLPSSFVVAQDEKMYNEAFLTSNASWKGYISGFVKPPIDGIRVFAILSNGVGLKWSNSSNADGSYIIAGLPPGFYSLYTEPNPTAGFLSFKWSFIEVTTDNNLTGYNITLTSENSPYKLDQVIIEFYPNTAFEDKMRVMQSHKSLIIDYNYAITSIEEANRYTLNIPDGKTVEEMIEAFSSEPEVRRVHPNRILGITGVKPQEEQLVYYEIGEGDETSFNNSEKFPENKEITSEDKNMPEPKPFLTYKSSIIMVTVLLIILLFFFNISLMKNKKRNI